MPETPPDGTITEVMEWVGDDPARAHAAIGAEEASESPRTTLIAQAEKVIDDHQQEEASMTSEPVAPESTEEPVAPPVETSPGDEESEAQGMSWDELAPAPPVGVAIHPLDPGVVVTPVEVFTPVGAEEAPDVEAAAINSEVDYNADYDDVEPFEADDVETLQVVAATSGAILVLNGTAYGFSGDGVNTLSRLLNRAVTAAHF